MDDQNRWRELHKLLGLPPESQAAAPERAPPRAEPPAEASAVPLPHREPEEERDLAEEELGEPLEEEVETPPPEEEEILPPPSAREEQEEEAEALADEEEPPRRGRRRGRRGRRGRPGREEEARRPVSLETDDTEVEPAEDVSGREHPLRSPDEEPAEDLSSEDEEELEPVSDSTDEDDDEPMETFADWNVPSWQEIVASLYRPDR